MNDSLLAILPDPSLLVTAQGVIVSANSPAAELLGASPGALAGQSLLALVKEPEGVAHFLNICARTRSTVPGALTWKTGNGELLETRCDGAVAEPAANGRPAVVYLRFRPKRETLDQFIALNEQVRALSNEVQERRRVEAALRRTEERYRTLVTATSSIVYTADSSGGFAERQPSWEAFTGQTFEEYRDSGAVNAVHPDDREQVREAWLRSVEAGLQFEYELRLWHAPSQSYHACISRAAPVHGSDGRVREWIGTIVDVEDRKRLEEQLRQTQKLESLGVLAGGVAHDFNNLLVGILGNAGLAVESLPANDRARRALLDVISASEAAAHLTKQLLAYAGKGRLVVEPLDLSQLVRQIAALIQASIPRTVQLRLELQNNLPPVEADLAQLQQLIMNLVINGAEAIPEGSAGTVTLVTGIQEVDRAFIQTAQLQDGIGPGKYVKLEVRDTGSGMSEDVRSRIFDPFFTTKFTGRGLGLAAAVGIVRGHKGAMNVYSAPGQGATFEVLFPASQRPARAPEKTAPAAQRRGSGMILVIDDESVVRQTAKAMLERCGYTVIVAENGQEGLDLFRAFAAKVTVVLLDMTMPVMSGEETFRQLKSINPEVQVVLSSGFNEAEATRRFAAGGLAGFLQKPYSAAALQEKLGRAIEEGQRQSQMRR